MLAIDLAGGGRRPRTDILVNNAGNSGGDRFMLASLVDAQPPDWELFLRINLYGVMYCTAPSCRT